MVKKKQKQKQKQTQSQIVNIHLGRERKPSQRSSQRSSQPPSNPPSNPLHMGYVSYTPSLSQMNRLVPLPEAQPYGQRQLHQLGVHRSEKGTQAGVPIPAYWNNSQQYQPGVPYNLLDNLSNVSAKASSTASLKDDVEDIVHSEHSLEAQHDLPKEFKKLTETASFSATSPASLSSYATDAINGQNPRDIPVHALPASSGVEGKEEESNAFTMMMGNRLYHEQEEKRNELAKKTQKKFRPPIGTLFKK